MRARKAFIGRLSSDGRACGRIGAELYWWSAAEPRKGKEFGADDTLTLPPPSMGHRAGAELAFPPLPSVSAVNPKIRR